MTTARSYPALRITASRPVSEFADLVAAVLDDFGVIAIQETSDGRSVTAFLADSTSRPAAAAAVRSALSGVGVEELDVPDENWAERSQASLKAVRVGSLNIAPPWDLGDSGPDRTIVISPSMGFGTGHHATTQLCLCALQDVGVSGKSIIDIGSGSGVLALAAIRLGAGRVVAIDSDPDAIANARQNAELNQLALDARCLSLDDVSLAADRFDLALANLTGATLIRFNAELRTFVPGGTLVVSGLREDEESDVTRALEGQVTMRSVLEGWVCLVVQVPQA